MSYIDAIDAAANRLQTILEKKLNRLKVECKDGEYREIMLDVLDAAQDLYNHLEEAIGLLKSYPGDEPKIASKFESELFGDVGKLECCCTSLGYRLQDGLQVWYVVSYSPPRGGINRIIGLLSKAMSVNQNTVDFARHVYSATRELQPTLGAIAKLKSRLKWTIMFPDSFSKDSSAIEDGLKKHGLDNAWVQLSSGIENYLSGDFQDSLNNIRNALTHLIKGIAAEYGVDEGGFGEQRSNLKTLGFIDGNTHGALGVLFGHLSKFSKGNAEPTGLDAKYLLQWALTLFGYLLSRLEEFQKPQE